jgi:hypothetical protein
MHQSKAHKSKKAWQWIALDDLDSFALGASCRRVLEELFWEMILQ